MKAEVKSSLIDLEARARVTGPNLIDGERLSERTQYVMRQSELYYNAEIENREESRSAFPPAYAGHKSNRLQFCDVKDPDHNQRHAGATFHWNVFSDVGTAGTSIGEDDTIPESNFTITQGTLSITEYGELLAVLVFKLVNNFCSKVTGCQMATVA